MNAITYGITQWMIACVKGSFHGDKIHLISEHHEKKWKIFDIITSCSITKEIFQKLCNFPLGVSKQIT